MALRVLLADESSSIKRVMELALQDFAVEVKPVFMGPDVIPISKQFKPDIIFVDILLQKLSGYDVALELKKSAEFRTTPVVVMWSGFMDFDESRFKASRADAKLEKPFTSDTLRRMILEFVPKTKTQNMSQFVHLPEILEELHQESARKTAVEEPENEDTVIDMDLTSAGVKPAPNPDGQWNMDSFESLDSFAQVKLGSQTNPKASKPGADEWVQQNLNQFKVPSPKTEDELLQEITARHGGDVHDEEAFDLTVPPQSRPAQAPRPQEPIFQEPKFTEEQLESIIRKQAKEMLESVIWKVVPDMAERLIREELNRLLKEKDGEIQID